MAKLTDKGSVIARCPGCDGAQSTFEWGYMARDDSLLLGPGRRENAIFPFGRIMQQNRNGVDIIYLLLRCAGCGAGAVAAVKIRRGFNEAKYPDDIERLLWFLPEARERLKLPEAVPQGIKNEFREAEQCLEADCFRAAAGLFRSVLDKTMRANGYKKVGDLKKQIEAAAADGVITESRKKRAHEDIRVLGNDVLHDEWMSIPEEDVEQAHHYAQRILEDFYDDRPTALAILRGKDRVAEEDK